MATDPRSTEEERSLLSVFLARTIEVAAALLIVGLIATVFLSFTRGFDLQYIAISPIMLFRTTTFSGAGPLAGVMAVAVPAVTAAVVGGVVAIASKGRTRGGRIAAMTGLLLAHAVLALAMTS